ncbi:hypothetical protein [Paenibacillus sp. Y412MC10]|uniref:hypothetical protein n=1 Tax=Geobacillus sp. (strain Y412MC10) TaxID=481743 RepID=UPI0011A8BD6E|nr:hypothetical protein [Paenibacillus sp. Y412MC10]
MQVKHKRIIRFAAKLIFLSVVLFYAFIYVMERPGGLTDRRMSRALGQDNILHIPLGKTPDNAVEQFRGPSSMHVIHREPVSGGTLLFMKRPYQAGSHNLQVEYVRKTRIGWKWAWGGGYGIGESSQSIAALNYMGMPELDHLSTPFPMVFGDILDPSIKKVSVKIKGKGSYNAKLTAAEAGRMIWFVFLPSPASTPFDIEGLDGEGNLIARKTITDPRDSGSVHFEMDRH